MKLNKHIMLIPLMLMAFNSYAENKLHGGVLLSHIEERGVVLPENLKNIHNSTTIKASTTATANYATGVHGNNVYASGNVGYQIYNDSSARRYYYVDIYMCIDNKYCTHTRDSIYLDPHLNAQGGGPVFVSAYISNPGKYEDEAIIVVSGGDNSTAKGVNVVQVS